MNFLKTEENLMKEIEHVEFLSKIDSQMDKIKSQISEVIPATLKSSESLSKGSKFTLPLKITGKMLGVGRHLERYYTEEELRKSVDTFKGSIPLKLDHRHKEASSTIGIITNLTWDPIERVVMYEGHINDETHARNVLDEITTEVSATIFSLKQYSELFGIIGSELEYAELSLVEEGAYSGNTLNPEL